MDRAKLTGNTQPLLMSRLFVYIHMNRVVDRNTRKCSNPFLHGCSIPARIPVYLDYSSFSSEIAAALAQGQGGWRVPNLERTGFAPPPPVLVLVCKLLFRTPARLLLLPFLLHNQAHLGPPHPSPPPMVAAALHHPSEERRRPSPRIIVGRVLILRRPAGCQEGVVWNGDGI